MWSAGLAPVKFVSGAPFGHERSGRIEVDPYLRVVGEDRVFALGDCAADAERPLPPTASVAEQQGAYLARCFNETYAQCDASGAGPLPTPKPVRPAAAPFSALSFIDRLWRKQSEFRYVERGAMASMGLGRGVVDGHKAGAPVNLTGLAAFVAWRGAYLSKQLSWTNMLLIPMFWFKSALLGRDISRF